MANKLTPITPLKIPPREYTREDFNQLVRTLNQVIETLKVNGDMIGTTLRITDCPETGYGLKAGGVYVDTSQNVLKLVMGSEAFTPIMSIRITARPVTVTIS